MSDVFNIPAAEKKILFQTESNGEISKRVETIAFKINDGN